MKLGVGLSYCLLLLLLAISGPLNAQNPPLTAPLLEKRLGDLDSILKHRVLRVLVTYQKGFYYLEHGAEKGINPHLIRELEKWLNRKYFHGKMLQLRVVMIPVQHDKLLTKLRAGEGDIAVSNITITQKRNTWIDFSLPIFSGVQELLVSRNNIAPIRWLEDLAGTQVWVRKSSSYYESLQRLNRRLQMRGLPPIQYKLLPEYLQDGDILEMVQGGLIPLTVVDSHVATLWQEVLPQLQLHRAFPVAKQRKIAWALRKGEPLLKEEINHFIKKHRKGTRFGNIVYGRYLDHGHWLQTLLRREPNQLFKSYGPLFRHYAQRYQIDWLLLTAQAFQESGLDQSKRSSQGAVGIMQVLPSTAKEPYINIPAIDQLENNIHAGTKYLRFILDHYFNDTDIQPHNRQLFALAAYNAGPNRVRHLRRLAKQQGFDTNQWFNHVEVVAARQLADETIHYVSNISKYYLAYQYIWSALDSQRIAAEHRWYQQRQSPIRAFGELSEAADP